MGVYADAEATLVLLVATVIIRMIMVEQEEHFRQSRLASLEIERRMEEGYRVRLQGEFYLTVKDDDPFRQRQAILFLRQLKGPTERRGSRATGATGLWSFPIP